MAVALAVVSLAVVPRLQHEGLPGHIPRPAAFRRVAAMPGRRSGTTSERSTGETEREDRCAHPATAARPTTFPRRLGSIGKAAMMALETLDATIARLDLALVRVDGIPDDPLAADELAFCLRTLAAQALPSGLGAELDGLLRQAIHLARLVEPDTVPSRLDSRRLRALLLDIAAAIATRARD